MNLWEVVVNWALVLVYFCIAYQDFKERAVYWWLYSFVFVLYGSNAFFNQEYPYSEVLINLGFLAVQYFFVVCYFAIKTRELRLLLLEDFGMGDALLILILALFLNTQTFILVYLSSLLSSLLWWGMIKIIKKRSPSIPLAGVMSLVMILIITLNYAV